MSPQHKAFLSLIKEKLKAIFPCVPLVFFPLYRKQVAIASAVCLAFSVLDNRSTGAFPL